MVLDRGIDRCRTGAGVINLTQLATLTLRTPREAARMLMAMDLGRDVLWTALALVSILNAIALPVLIASSAPEVQAQFPSYLGSPLAVFVLLAGIMVIYVHSVYWAGLALGGEGRLDDVLALLVWLQVLRTVVQLSTLVLTFVVPVLAGLLSLVALVWAFWILLNFVAEALKLPSLGHAFVALALALVGLVLGMGILLAIIGVVAQGTLNNV